MFSHSLDNITLSQKVQCPSFDHILTCRTNGELIVNNCQRLVFKIFRKCSGQMWKWFKQIESPMHVDIIEIAAKVVILAHHLNEVDVRDLNIFINDKQDVLIRNRGIVETCSNIVGEGMNTRQWCLLVSMICQIYLRVKRCF